MPTTTTVARQRALSTNVVLSLGMLSVGVDLVNQFVPNLGKETSTKQVCPTCAAGEEPHMQRLSQRLHCGQDVTHGPFGQEDVLKARELEDGTLVLVSAEEVAAMRTSEVEKGGIELRVFPAAEFEARTRPGESGYRLRPPAKATKATLSTYGALMAIAEREDVALVGEYTFRSTAKLYRLNVWVDVAGGRQLCVSEVVRPDNLMPLDEITVPAPSEKVLAMADALIEAFTEEFDPDEIRNTARERAAALDAAKAADPDAVSAPAAEVSKPVPAGDDLEAILEAALAARKITTNRKARPATPRKRTPAKAKATVQ